VSQEGSRSSRAALLAGVAAAYGFALRATPRATRRPVQVLLCAMRDANLGGVRPPPRRPFIRGVARVKRA